MIRIHTKEITKKCPNYGKEVPDDFMICGMREGASKL